jgi:poly-gamma-glutamate capsule biosynthesis protein CapA/YwtB (metallophosphatase superfamily)
MVAYLRFLVVAFVPLAVACSPTADIELSPGSVSTTAAPVTEVAPPSSTTLPTTTETAPARRPITLGFGGDTSFTGGLDRRDPFGQIGDLLRDPDLMMVNLETVVADEDVGRPPVAKRFLFKSPPASLDLLVEAGIDVVGLANNHTLDFGPDALAQTLDEIDARGLARVGAGLDQDAAYTPLVVPVGDWMIGLVSLSRVPCDWSASGENVRPQVAWACPPFADLADGMVEATMAEADVTVVVVHGGEEGVLCPSAVMIEIRQHWAELGVDVVIDGHPHVLQGITSIEGTMIAHSTGNFAFPSASGLTANSAVFLIDVTEEGVSLRVEPLRVNGGVLTMPSAQQRASIVAQMNSVSSGWQIDEDGVARLDPTAVGC